MMLTMDNSFDRLLKQKLADQSPESLGFRPDREKLWQQVEAKKKQKARLIPLWLSHTAAVAAGLLIAFFFLPHKSDHTTSIAPAVANRQTIVKTDTVLVMQPAPAASHSTIATAPPHRSHSTAATSVIVPGPAAPAKKTPVPAIVVTDKEPEAPVDEPVVAAAPKQAPKVLHLADMNNENTVSPQRRNQPGAFLPANLALPGDGGTALSATAVQLFTKSKN